MLNHPLTIGTAAGFGITAVPNHLLYGREILQRHPIPNEITPRRSVYIIGISTIVLIAATTIAQLL